MSIEESIIKAVSKPIQELTSRLDRIEKKLDALKAKEKEKNFEERLNFLLPEEAEERLKVSRPTLNKLIKNGELKVSISPGGRVKILESSLNEYIRAEAGA